MKSIHLKILALGLLMAGFVHVNAQTFAVRTDGQHLSYVKDSRGNRLLDYSTCGYRNSNVDIPSVKGVVFVSHREGDNSERIQRALDYVASLKPDANGFRGAVLLDKGTFDLSEPLRIKASGVVLRGVSKEETVLKKNGVDRCALIYIEGINDCKETGTTNIVSDYVPVNALTFDVASGTGLQAGDRVMIYRPCTKEWISSLGCEIFGGGISALGWKAGDVDLYWDRTITAVEGNKVTIDAPLSMALDKEYGQCALMPYAWDGRVSDSGVENLTLMSDYNKKYPMDEDHCWSGISIENAENCWVRMVDFKHFAGSAVIVQRTGARITVEDCRSLEPVSELAGMRRRSFYTMGQQVLFQRCYSEHAMNDFVAGYSAAGPNAFVQCDSWESNSFSGSIGSWAAGLLFDIVNIDGHDLKFMNLGQDKVGAGWNTGNSLFWQCTANKLFCYTPVKDAPNRAYGCWGAFSGDGEWGESNNHVNPRSFFYAQLAERLQADVSKRARLLPRWMDATSSPTVEQAAEMAKQSLEPRLTLDMWIEQNTCAASVDATGLKSVDDIKASPKQAPAKMDFSIVNGHIVADGLLLEGNRQEVTWWNGRTKYNFIKTAKPHVTRFVPDQEGLGLTDRIDSALVQMKRRGNVVFDHNYGLWYDLRRTDHERIRRRDGDVWAPLYEQPFGRSGQGKAWDGLSKYDLTRPNAWYWYRLKTFADKAEAAGMMLFHQNYFQHNILEAGAHWVDCPWRDANNINNTDMGEPVNFAGDKRIFVADKFYDINHPVRRELHRQYIRQCLNNFADNKNVVQLISAEYTGPLHFMEFWLDCIAEWEQETGKHATVALSVTKDVQDAILNDPKRAAVVDIIDIRYWHYRADGSLYAPEGGKNMAPRQHARKMKVGKMGYEGAYRAVSEYRMKYPDKAVVLYAQDYPAQGWAVLMGGGSCPNLQVADKDFLADVPYMNVVPSTTADYEMIAGEKQGAVLHVHKAMDVKLSLPSGKYCVKYITSKDCKVSVLVKSVKVKGDYTLHAEKEGIYWLQRL